MSVTQLIFITTLAFLWGGVAVWFVDAATGSPTVAVLAGPLVAGCMWTFGYLVLKGT